MAMIECPECGNAVSDRAAKCPRCGYPLQSMEKIENIQTSNVEQQKDDTVYSHKPVRKPKKILLIVLGFVVASTVCILLGLGYYGTDVNVQDITVGKWKLVDASEYSDIYEGTIATEELKPFVAVIGSYENEDNAPAFVYMENGEGLFQTYEGKETDPSVKYTPIGYMTGRAVRESDFKEIRYKDYDYFDWDFANNTGCTLDIDFEFNTKSSGLLFFELQNDLTSEIQHNCIAVIVDGKGSYSNILSELPFKSRGVEVEAVPKFFCPAGILNESSYNVEKEFDIEKSEETYSTTFSGTEEISLIDKRDGLVLYTSTLIDGGEKELRGKTDYQKALVREGSCTLTTALLSDSEDNILMPTYDIEIAGYIPWETLK